MISIRVRSLVWFVTGAMVATAVTLMFVNAWRADAAPGNSDTTFVPITPGCRFADTRQAGQGGPIGPGETRQFTAHGVNNDCTIPADAVAVLMNVTADRQTASISFLSIWGSGANPGTSALNPAAGEPPTPNAVTTDLTGGGVFNVYNDAGSVDVIIDINGYYTTASLTDLASRVAAVEAAQAAGVDPAVLARITANETNIAALDDREPFAVTARTDFAFIGETPVVVHEVQLTAPAAGQVTVASTAEVGSAFGGTDVFCSITTPMTTPVVDSDYTQRWESGGDTGVAGAAAQMAATRTFDIAAEATATYQLVCKDNDSGSLSGLSDMVLTAIYTPAP